MADGNKDKNVKRNKNKPQKLIYSEEEGEKKRGLGEKKSDLKSMH